MLPLPMMNKTAAVARGTSLMSQMALKTAPQAHWG
jgi:hypothetical protein